jgi:hypothetical protein
MMIVPNYEMIDDSDMIILETLESYLRKTNYQLPEEPNMRAFAMDDARNRFYTNIIQRLPKIAAILVSVPPENDPVYKDKVDALFMAMSNHALDPVFVSMTMQFLMTYNNPETSKLLGALFAKIMHRYITENVKMTKAVGAPAAKAVKGKKKEEVVSDQPKAVETSNIDEVAVRVVHLRDAVRSLLGGVAKILATGNRFGNITDEDQALGLASVLVLHSEETIRSILDMDMSITADVFDILDNNGQTAIIRTILLLEKEDYVKLTTNGQLFMESVKRWVFNKLNGLDLSTLNAFLLSVYNSLTVDTNKYFIRIKDCGTQYSNLLIIAKQIVNK